MSARATRVARGSSASSRGSSWFIFFPSASSVLASSPRDDDAKGAGRSGHARRRRGRSDDAPLPTQRWHARTFAPGDVRGARLRAPDLVHRTPCPRICRESRVAVAPGKNADAAPRAETVAIALAGDARQMFWGSEKLARLALFRRRWPISAFVIRLGLLAIRNRLGDSRRCVFGSENLDRGCLRCLPLSETVEFRRADSRGTARGSARPPDRPARWPLSAEACPRSSPRRRS